VAMWGAVQSETETLRGDESRKTKRRRLSRPRAALWRRIAAKALFKRLTLKRAPGQDLRAVGNVPSGKIVRRPTVGVYVRPNEAAFGLAAFGGTFFFRSGSGRFMRLQLMTQDAARLKVIFGKAFKAARREAGLTQEAITGRTGVAQSEISKIERLDPRANPTLETMGKLARAVNKPLHELLTPE
jgi:DNA-binding XRE family transcriptional regulator